MTNTPAYYVFVEDINGKRFAPYNVFDHHSFLKYIKINFRVHGDDREKFDERLKKEAMYYFWAKCEWEIVISSWPPSERDKPIKVDAYDQLMMNWDIFSDYVWSHKDAILEYHKNEVDDNE